MMKLLKRRSESDKITEQILFLLLLLLFLFPFFKEHVQSFLIILLGIASLANAWLTKKIIFDKNVWFFLLPFLLVTVDCLIRNESLEPANKVLYFVFFPFIFSNIPNQFFSNKNINLYNRILQISAFTLCCTYIMQFFIDYTYSDLFTYHYNVPKFRHYMYFEMKFFKIHPTYLTFILTYCIVASLRKIRNNGLGVDLFLVIFYLLFSMFLMTKLNLIFQIGVILYFLFFETGLNFLRKCIIFGSALALFLATITFMPNLLNRFVEIPKSLAKKPEGLAFDSTNIRVAIYNCDIELVEKHYAQGVGFNNIQKYLNDCYASNYNTEFYKQNNYLSHNYFFYVFISSGVLGFFGLLLFFVLLFKLTLKINSFIVYVLVFNVFSMCFIEDFFYRQFGLFSFLLLFFMHYKNYVDNQKNSGVRENNLKLS